MSRFAADIYGRDCANAQGTSTWLESIRATRASENLALMLASKELLKQANVDQKKFTDHGILLWWHDGFRTRARSEPNLKDF
jgi:hypothetical protein